MKRSLLVTVLLIFAFPTLCSTVKLPFSTVVYAGHTQEGFSCECGAQDCICDPGEQLRTSASAKPPRVRNEKTGLSLGAELALLSLEFLLWLRV